MTSLHPMNRRITNKLLQCRQRPHRCWPLATNVGYIVSTVSSWASQGVPKYVLYTKCPFRWGGSGLTRYMVYWAHQSTHPIRHFDRFSRFSTAHGRRNVTSSQTHTCIHIHNERGGTENAGLEVKTGKRGTKSQGRKRRDWKTRDQISRGGKGGTGKRRNIMCMGSKM